MTKSILYEKLFILWITYVYNNELSKYVPAKMNIMNISYFVISIKTKSFCLCIYDSN